MINLFKSTNPVKKKVVITVGIIFVPAVLYFLDVWIIGTVAAWIHGLGIWCKGHSFYATPEQKAAAAHAFDHVAYYLHHPFYVAKAWLFKKELSRPEVRQIWLILNLIVLMLACIGIAWWKLGGHQLYWSRRDSKDRDITKLSFARVKFQPICYVNRTPAGQIFLGLDDRRRPVTVPTAKMTEHIHVLGGSGTGKTSFVVIPICIQAIKRKMAVIVIDFKGDKQAIQILAREARAAGRRFFFFSLHPEVKSNTYNPLASGSALSKVERIMTALELIFEGEARFYTYCQQAVFLPLIKFLDSKEIKYTLKDIQHLLQNPELVEEITGDKMTPGQVKGLTAALAPYDLDAISDPEPDIDLAAIMNAGDVAYFDLRSAVAPEVSSALGKMIALDLQAQAAFRTGYDRLAVIAIDEFQNMACQAFRNIIAKVRSANYALLLANQALGDLRAVGEDFLNTIVTNTGTKIVFGIEDPADAEYFARRSGQVVVPTYSESTSTSRPAGSIFTRDINKGESAHDYDKHLIHANVFLRLPFGKSVIFRRRKLAVLANHAHLITRSEKERLEQMPYPEPEAMEKSRVKTVSQLIDQMKAERFRGQPRQRPGRPQNDLVQTEDISM